MKVFHAAETIKGGVATIINTLVESQLQIREIEEIYTLTPSDQIKSLNNFDNVDNYFFKRNGRSLIAMISFGFVFFKIMKIKKPNIIHLHSSFSGAIGRLIIFLFFRKENIKVIYCPHAFGFLMQTSETKRKLYGFIERILAKTTEKIICTSNYEKMCALEYGIQEEKLITIYNGISAPCNVEKLMNPYPDLSLINLLFVGRLDFQKGYDNILKLAEILPPKYRITIIGESVNSTISVIPNKNITYYKWLSKSELANFFYFSDYVLMPSRWESFGLVAVEAQSYGTPVIASNNTSLPEVIIQNQTGFLCDTTNLNEFLNIVRSCDKKLSQEMSKECILNYKQNFTKDIMCEKTFNLYVN